MKKSEVCKATESMWFFLLDPPLFHYVSILTISTDVEAVNITLYRMKGEL